LELILKSHHFLDDGFYLQTERAVFPGREKIDPKTFPYKPYGFEGQYHTIDWM
jgi:hypothetical protein